MEPTVFIVDPARHVVQSATELLGAAHVRAMVFDSGRSFLSRFDSRSHGCVVSETRLPDMSGLDLMARIRDRGSVIPTILTAVQADIPTAIRAIRGGALDYLVKPFEGVPFLDAIYAAFEWDRRHRRFHAEWNRHTARAAELTPRELEVMKLVVSGLANKQMAAKLGCATKTVEVHRARVMQKMSVANVADLVRISLLMDGAWGQPALLSGQPPIHPASQRSDETGGADSIEVAPHRKTPTAPRAAFE